MPILPFGRGFLKPNVIQPQQLADFANRAQEIQRHDHIFPQEISPGMCVVEDAESDINKIIFPYLGFLQRPTTVSAARLQITFSPVIGPDTLLQAIYVLEAQELGGAKRLAKIPGSDLSFTLAGGAIAENFSVNLPAPITLRANAHYFMGIYTTDVMIGHGVIPGTLPIHYSVALAYTAMPGKIDLASFSPGIASEFGGPMASYLDRNVVAFYSI